MLKEVTKAVFTKALVLSTFVIVVSKYVVMAVTSETTSRTPYHVVVEYSGSGYRCSAEAGPHHLLGQYFTSTVSWTRKQHPSVGVARKEGRVPMDVGPSDEAFRVEL